MLRVIHLKNKREAGRVARARLRETTAVARNAWFGQPQVHEAVVMKRACVGNEYRRKDNRGGIK